MFYKLYRFLRKNILLFGLAVLLFSIFINIPIWLASNGKIKKEISNLENKKYGLLLGTSKYNLSGKKNLFYDYRIKAAIELYNSKKIKKIILSGTAKDGGYDELGWMESDLLKNKIPKQDILVDSAGFRTNASIKNTIKKYGSDFIIISQKFHSERAIFLAYLDGVEVQAYEAKSPNWKYSSQIYLREIFARIKLIFYDILLEKLKFF